MAEKKVLVVIADGSEEIEAVCVIDILRRAKANVTVASIKDEKQVTASRGVHIVSFVLFYNSHQVFTDITLFSFNKKKFIRLQMYYFLSVLTRNGI